MDFLKLDSFAELPESEQLFIVPDDVDLVRTMLLSRFVGLTEGLGQLDGLSRRVGGWT